MRRVLTLRVPSSSGFLPSWASSTSGSRVGDGSQTEFVFVPAMVAGQGAEVMQIASRISDYFLFLVFIEVVSLARDHVAFVSRAR